MDGDYCSRFCSHCHTALFHQSCFLQTVHNENNQRFNMGCQSNQLCSSSGVDAGAIIGRSIQRRQHYACHECCSTDSCNHQLCAHGKPSACVDDPTLDCARLNSLFNVCADIHHVKATCPKFCGLCKLVDGNWAEWATWEACSVTCQNGTQTRARSCTNPSPSNGGLDCSGPSVQNKMCSNQLCPVHGNWTDWSTWSDCSVTCDVGLRKRSRSCSNPKPDRFGDYCVGDTSENTVCLADPCNYRNGGWSSWGSWQSCSVTCGVGLKARHRTCTNPSPSAYGKACEGDPFENTVCLADPCNYGNGGWSSWGSWQSCSVTCGVGLKASNRTCTNPSPSAYGKACEGNSETSAVCVNRPCTSVSFIAHGVNILAYQVFAFPTIVLNDGNAYSPSTGHFRAPVDGLYSFTTQFCTVDGHHAYFYIEKGSASMTNITRLTVSLHQGTLGSCSSASTHVQLSRNENVWVRMGEQFSSSAFLEDVVWYWNFFNGMLIQEI